MPVDMKKILSSVMLGSLLTSCGVFSSDPVATPAPPEIQQALVLEHEATIRRTQTDFPKALKGGPGFTRDTAWQVLIKDRFAVSIQYLVLGRLGLGEHQLQALVVENGRSYDMHIIEVEHGGKRYAVEQWFDITPYFNAH